MRWSKRGSIEESKFLEERQKKLKNAAKDDKFDVKLVKIKDKSKYCINPEVYKSNIVKISKINTMLEKKSEKLNI